jgi:hypothetical protein
MSATRSAKILFVPMLITAHLSSAEPHSPLLPHNQVLNQQRNNAFCLTPATRQRLKQITQGGVLCAIAFAAPGLSSPRVAAGLAAAGAALGMAITTKLSAHLYWSQKAPYVLAGGCFSWLGAGLCILHQWPHHYIYPISFACMIGGFITGAVTVVCLMRDEEDAALFYRRVNVAQRNIQVTTE